MSFILKLRMIYHGFKNILHNVNVTSKGQCENYKIMQTSHRLEKGLCVREPKKLWGYEKAYQLIELIETEGRKKDKDVKAIEVGKAVIAAFISSKEKCDDVEETNKLSEFKKNLYKKNMVFQENVLYGGKKKICKRDILFEETNLIEKLFKSRHSIRDFEDSKIDIKKLEKAIDLATYAPSACNRQAVKVYVIDGEDRIKAGSNNEYYADKYLIICGCMSGFAVSELNDWIVGASIFAGYLSLSLHAYGIGSCVIRKNIIAHSDYNDNIRKMCNIPENEQIILEMAIGNYKESLIVPVSYRKETKDILHYIRHD